MKVASIVASLMASALASSGGAVAPDTTALMTAAQECAKPLQSFQTGSCSQDFQLLTAYAVPGSSLQDSQIQAFCSSTCYTEMKDAFTDMAECFADVMKDNYPEGTEPDAATQQMLDTMGGMYTKIFDLMCTYDPAKEQYCLSVFSTLSSSMSTIGSVTSYDTVCNAWQTYGCCFTSLMAISSDMTAAAGAGSTNPMLQLCPNTAFAEPCLGPGETETAITATLTLDNVKADWFAALTQDDLNKLEADLKTELAVQWGCDAKDISLGDVKDLLSSKGTVVIVVVGDSALTAESVKTAKLTSAVPTTALADATKSASAEPSSAQQTTIEGAGGGGAKTSASSRVAASVLVAVALAAVA